MQSRSVGQSAVVLHAPPPAKTHCLIAERSALLHPDSIQTEPTEQSSFVSQNLSEGHERQRTLVVHGT
ncbi:MAG: hypothetical protein JRD92_01890 [Deltaproteobacteria bacterium]|nr:hypothetical protein [Deltaproteobacteria bacterium]MBW2585681.1 hypothetical protein [Deltaproteobacteria bacterium]